MMKKAIYLGLIILAALVSVSASVWEGAASVSFNGELPESGYYAATKSFPRNTIVDITNLETGMTIRVIVASGLDSPGLLAVLSREAANAIGLPIRSVGRIRMTMPSDPVAFSRFPEVNSSSGDPDFDPLAVIAAAGNSGLDVKEASETLGQDSEGARDADSAVADIVDLPVTAYTPPPSQETNVPANADSGPDSSALFNYSPEPPSTPPETAVIAQPQTALSAPMSQVPPIPQAEPTMIPAEPRPPVSSFSGPSPDAEIPPIEKPDARTEMILGPIIPPIDERPSTPPARTELVLEPMIPPIEGRPSTPPARTELVLEPMISPIEERPSVPPARTEPVLEPIVPPIEERPSTPPARMELVLEPIVPPIEERASVPLARAEPALEPIVPIEERASVPLARTELVLEPIVPPIEERTSVPPARTEPVLEPMISPIDERPSMPLARTEPVLEPMISPIEERTSVPPARADLVLGPIIPPIDERSSVPLARTEPVLEPMISPIDGRTSVPPARTDLVLEPIIPPIDGRNPAPPSSVPSVKAVFSVPKINNLEKGKYYLQLAAYTLPELVEDELARIGSTYPRAVQETGNPEKPLYRILIGPMNLGESGALLQRFKTSGYRDAFVRKEG